MFNWLHRECKEYLDIQQELTRQQVMRYKGLWEESLKEITDLKSQLPTLLHQIQEQKGILEYSMHEKEQHIEALMAEIDCLKKENETLKIERDYLKVKINDHLHTIAQWEQIVFDLKDPKKEKKGKKCQSQ